MVNIEALQNSFLINWGKMLLSENQAEWKQIPLIFYKRIGGLSIFHSNVKTNEFKGFEVIKSCFWKKVLTAWIEHKGVDKEKNICLRDLIFNNDKIRFKGKPLYVQNLINRNISYVRDLYEGHTIIGIEKFKEKVGTYNGIDFDYYAITNAFINKQVQFDSGETKEEIFQKLSRREIYNRINVKGSIDHVKHFWERKGCDLASDYWELPIKCTREIKLRLIQWKILHNIYPTNILFKKMKIRESDMCQSCEETDFIEHFFFQCKTIKRIWKFVEKIILISMGISIKFNQKDVMLGISQLAGVKKDDVLKINHMIMVGKMVISKIKYGPYKYNAEIVLEQELRMSNLM